MPLQPCLQYYRFNIRPFVRRLSDQFWIIHDTKRNFAAVYNTSKCVFTDLPAELQYQSAKTDDQFEELWKNYFNSICIKDRVNPKLQKQTCPKSIGNTWLKNNKCTFILSYSTSSGAIYPCLLRNVKVEAFESIKQGKEATKEALLKAVSIKPVAGNPEEVGPDMSEIGG